MIQVLLIPLDGSELAEATLPYAKAIQRAFGSKLVLLRVVGRPKGTGDCVEWRLSQAEARSYVDGIVEGLRGEGVEAEAIVTAGKPSEAILETAREQKADLVAVSSHGAGGTSPFKVCGTAHKVLSSGDVSVLLVRTGENSRLPKEGIANRILVPMDGSARSEWALRFAATVARSSGAELLMLQVLSPPDVPLPPEKQVQLDRLFETGRSLAIHRLEGWVARLEGPDLTIRSNVMVARSVPRTIDEVATRGDFSLVVLSAHGTTPTDTWPRGSVADALLQYGTTPILVLQDAPTRAQKERSHRSRRRRARPETVWTT